jgi:hypothetical protein
MTASVICGFSKMRDAALSIRAYNIVEKMNGNPNFPMLSSVVSDVSNALEEYRHACEQAQNGGKDKTAVKKAKRIVLVDQLYTLGKYVQVHCQNDLAILLSTGFDARKPWTRRSRVLLPPDNFKLENGPYPGSMKASVRRTPGVKSYVFEYAAIPITEETKWTQISIASRVYMLQGLTSGQQYAFRVTGVGYDPKPVYSDVVTRFAL